MVSCCRGHLPLTFLLLRRFSCATVSQFGGTQVDQKPHARRELFYHLVAWIVPLAFYLDCVVRDRVGLGHFFG